MGRTISELRRRREEILAIAARHGARNVRVFGSIARGDSGPDSDIDFVVEFEPDRSLLDHGGLIMDLQDVLGCKVDVVSLHGLRDRMRARVDAESIAI
jgi:predicted nucleotidyltransferase